MNLPNGDNVTTGKVVGQKRGPDGEMKGVASTNPILDTRIYNAEFPNGEVSEYSVNVIAENMFAQCDMEGNQFAMLSSLVDHKKDGHDVEVADGFVQRGNNRHRRITTKGWKICV